MKGKPSFMNVKNASIFLEGTSFTTVTDESGNFDRDGSSVGGDGDEDLDGDKT